MFGDYSVPDPDYDRLRTAVWKARHEPATLTAGEAMLLASIYDGYAHFVGHPAPTRSIVEQLRTVRAYIRERRERASSSPDKKEEAG